MDELSFDSTKLNEVYELLNTYYNEYKEIISSLELEIKNLEVTWGSRDQSVYNTFKEKYDEKKKKLIETENMMKELLDALDVKKEEIMEATIQSENNFE